VYFFLRFRLRFLFRFPNFLENPKNITDVYVYVFMYLHIYILN
jgi:hypothetical protein